jgi:hypothetical protein
VQWSRHELIYSSLLLPSTRKRPEPESPGPSFSWPYSRTSWNRIRVNFLELRSCEVRRMHPGRTSGSVKLHSWITALGQQGTEAEPGRLGDLRLMYPRCASRAHRSAHPRLHAAGPEPLLGHQDGIGAMQDAVDRRSRRRPHRAPGSRRTALRCPRSEHAGPLETPDSPWRLPTPVGFPSWRR